MYITARSDLYLSVRHSVDRTRLLKLKNRYIYRFNRKRSITLYSIRTWSRWEIRGTNGRSSARIDPYIHAFLRERREESVGGRRSGRGMPRMPYGRVDPEINGALITLIEALRRIDTTPIGPVSFRDTDRSYDK